MRGYTLVLVVVLVVFAASLSMAGAPPEPYFDGFEGPLPSPDSWGENGWNQYDGSDLTRVPSGTDGVPAASGDYFGKVTDGGPYTRFGGYDDVWRGGWGASIDFYFDVTWAENHQAQAFDWSVACTGADGNHLRDFIFHTMTGDGTVSHGPVGAFTIWADNNTNFNSSLRNIPNLTDPLTITETGWYTFRHWFYEDTDGALSADMSVLDSDGTVLAQWTRHDPNDLVGSVAAGNRYGWLIVNGQYGFDAVYLDNVTRTTTPEPATIVLLGISGLVGGVIRRRRIV